MKKHLRFILSAGCALLTTFAFAQNDSWTQVMGNGFGSTSTQAIFSIDDFNGNIYCGTDNKLPSTSPAQLWTSSTGNSGSFTQVSGSSFTPALKASDYVITALSHTNLSPGYMYLGTTNIKSGMVVYSSTDGSTWTKISKRGMGTSKNYDIVPDIVVFNPGTGTTADSNYIYISVRDTTSGQGASIWRTLYNDQDSTHWKKVFDMSTLSPAIQQTTWLYVWGDTLYCAGQDVNRVSQLYQTTDGIHWTANTGAANGFGDASNEHIACMAAYKNILYATTFDAATGAQVWKTSGGNTWTRVTNNAFGLGQGITEIRRAFVFNGFLWISGQWFINGTASPDMVWRTDDGITWAQSNKPGFGVSTNEAGFPSLGYFNHQVYEGTYNTSTGAQLWRTTEGIPVAGFTSSQATLCQGDSVAFTDTSNTATSYSWLVNGSKITPAVNMTYTFNTAGTFTVALAAFNDTMSDTVTHTITVNPTPTITVTGHDTINKGQSDTLTASGASTYTWAPSTGLNTTSGGTVIATPTATTTYTVTGANASGCSSTHTFTVHVNTTVSISTLTLNSNCTIYPNPSGGTIYISGLPPGMDAEAILTDITGRTVYKQQLTVNNNRTQLQTALPDGMYIITIKTNKGNIILQKQIGISK